MSASILARGILASVLLFASATGKNVNSAKLAEPAHFDEYGNICWEDELNRLDKFAVQLQKDESMIGYIIVYAGSPSCGGEARYRAERAKKWIVKRGVNSNRVIAKDGGYRSGLVTTLHLQSKNDPGIVPRPTLSKDEASVVRRCVDKVFARVLCLKQQ